MSVKASPKNWTWNRHYLDENQFHFVILAHVFNKSTSKRALPWPMCKLTPIRKWQTCTGRTECESSYTENPQEPPVGRINCWLTWQRRWYGSRRRPTPRQRSRSQGSSVPRETSARIWAREARFTVPRPAKYSRPRRRCPTVDPQSHTVNCMHEHAGNMLLSLRKLKINLRSVYTIFFSLSSSIYDSRINCHSV